MNNVRNPSQESLAKFVISIALHTLLGLLHSICET